MQEISTTILHCLGIDHMRKQNDQTNREYVERWRRAGPALARIRRQELRNYVHKNHLAAIDALLQIGFERGTPRLTSGLVDFQRWLARGRR